MLVAAQLALCHLPLARPLHRQTPISAFDISTRTATIRVDPGETVVCTFTNTEDDTIAIEKVTIPAGVAGSFSFSQTLDSSGNFALDGGQSRYFTNISPGKSYTVIEADPTPGFDLTAIECHDTATTFPGDLGTRTATLNMTAGETVHCAFTNTQRGTIIVDKVTDPAGDPQSFDFGLTGGPDSIAQNFALKDADPSHDSGLQKPGVYSVVETLVPGWDLTSAVCDDGSNPANIDLNPGETVTCTFTNTQTKRGKIIVDKVTDPAGDPQPFDFTLHGGPDSVSQSFALTDADTPYDSGDLKPGNYNVHEHLLTGWDLFDATCDDGSDPASIDLAPGETVKCTFSNAHVHVNLIESYAVSSVTEGQLSGEGSIACSWVTLSTKPAGDVTISMAPQSGLVTLDKSSVTLNGSNWNNLTLTNRSNFVCMRAVDDKIDNSGPQICKDGNDNIINPKDPRQAMKNQDIFGNGPDDHLVNGDYLAHIGHSAASADPKFDNTSNFTGNGPNFDNDVSTIDVLMRDDDHARVVVAPAHLSVREGTTGKFQVSLGSQPTAPVTVSSSTTRSADSQDLVFDASNWNQPQEMTISVPEDDIATGPQQKAIQLRVTSADNNYQGLIPAPVDVVIVDDDSAGVMVSTTQLALSEGGGEATYEVSLTSQPAADLTITLVGDQVTTTPAALTFTQANWDQSQTVRVKAVDDDKVEANGHVGSIRHVASSADGTYNDILISNVDAAIQDNDSAGLTASGASGLQVNEGGADASYSVRLTAQPNGAVLVSLSGGGQLNVEPSALTFTDQNWDQPQTVTVQALDDAVDEGDSYQALVSYSLTGDPTYQGLPVAPQSVTVVDNDTAGVRLSTTAIQADRGDKATYTVALTSQPLDDVVVDLTTTGGVRLDMPACNAEGAGACLVFTAANWNLPQTVTVSVAGPGQVTHSVLSSDGLYDGLAASPVDVSLGAGGNNSIFLPLVNK